MADYDNDNENEISDVESESDNESNAGGYLKGGVKKTNNKKEIEYEEGEVDDEDDVSVGSDDDEDEEDNNDSDDDVENIENSIVDVDQLTGEQMPHFDDLGDDDEEDDEDDDEDYLQKFDENLQQTIIQDHHPELHIHNYEEIDAVCNIVRDDSGIIIDPFHKTIPFVSRYEKARILGERAKQINAGAEPFIEVEPSMIDGYLIALKEFEEKKIPFIVQRPLPSGGCEYWRLKDLDILA